MYLAVTEVAPFAEYTPSASNETPPAKANTLSQSVSNAENPEPRTAPALLQISMNKIRTIISESDLGFQESSRHVKVTTSEGHRSGRDSSHVQVEIQWYFEPICKPVNYFVKKHKFLEKRGF